ncbi:hypothetical protein EMCG_04197 [[Emmonsia] crescens]|uniref:Uncharacterized protein n=1 Tax=[Emmonsia] crescens TaxID=73230 RepID=A0A0G2IZ68_9EURO|nr:hypothetical protein EMCG_04197 [Emmonsia crescens UAMH 3008]
MEGPSHCQLNRHAQDIGDINDNEGRGTSSSSLDRTDLGDTSPIMNSPNKLRTLRELHMNTPHRLRSLGRVGTTKVDANDGTILSEDHRAARRFLKCCAPFRLAYYTHPKFFKQLDDICKFCLPQRADVPEEGALIPVSEEESPQLFDKYASDYMFGYQIGEESPSDDLQRRPEILQRVSQAPRTRNRLSVTKQASDALKIHPLAMRRIERPRGDSTG